MLSKARIFFTALLVSSSVFTSTAHADALGDWRKEVVKKVAETRTYPRSAISREIEGRAMVLLKVAQDGTITAHQVLQPTGQQVLDREIPKLVSRLNPLPPLPAGEKDASLVVPISWVLE